MSRITLARRINEVARLSGTFTLRSGETSDTYFDKYRFESEPAILADIANEMRELVPVDTDVLCGLELGGVPVVTMLSQVTGIPAAFIRKAPKSYGTCKYAEGPDLEGKRLLIVEDVVSSGGAIIDAVTMMREDGLSVAQAVCVIDRRPAGSGRLDELGITLTSLFTRQDFEQA